jgi:hypothetical protein
MATLMLPTYSWESGAFIMIGIFALVIIALLGAIYLMMHGNKKND